MGIFAVQLQGSVNKTKDQLDTIVQVATHDLFKKIILSSPVDTGHFRQNWIASAGGYSTNTIEGFDKEGSATVERMAKVVLSTKAGGVVYLVNNLPYAMPLEYGYSKRAPRGMIRIAIADAENFFRQVV